MGNVNPSPPRSSCGNVYLPSAKPVNIEPVFVPILTVDEIKQYDFVCHRLTKYATLMVLSWGSEPMTNKLVSIRCRTGCYDEVTFDPGELGYWKEGK